MNTKITINSETAPATAKLVTRLAAGLVEFDNLLSRVCGNFGKCEPGGCPLYPTQDELDEGEYRDGCIWVNANEDLLVYVMEAYRDWRDKQRQKYITDADDIENCLEQVANLGNK